MWCSSEGSKKKKIWVLGETGDAWKAKTKNERRKLSGINRKSIGPFSIVKDIFNKARCKSYS